MTRSILPILIWISMSFQLFAQNPSTSFAPWRNNAKGAYSLIHDDFGDPIVSGIENYADTIAFNRGVKFTFGAITGSCDAADWVNANRLVSHGHEVMNHTHNHYCAMDPGWCSTQTWANFATELDQSTTLIQNNTSVYPRFFIWPFDITTQASKDYLRDNLHYYGARGGIQNQSLNTNQLNNTVITDFMSLNFSVYAPTTSATELNGLVDLAIANGKWGIRETHGVNDGSWASVTLADYRAHMNYIRSKMLSNDIWCATASEVTTYKMQTQNFIPTTTYSAVNQEIRINWNDPSIDLTDLRSDVTLNVNLDGLTGYIYIYQANTQISAYTITSGILSFNTFPHKGEIIIRKTPWTIFPPGPFTITSTTVCSGQSSVAYEVPVIAGATYIWTYSGSGVTINNGSSNHVTLDFSSTAASGVLSVKSVTTAGTSPEANVSVTVNAGYQTQGASRCGAGSVTLQILTAGQYEWYNASSGGTLLSSANTYQPTVANTTTYYTQRKTVVNNYALGKVSQGASNLNTIWWFPSYAQRMTIQKTMVLSTVKVWGTGITNATLAVVNPANGAIVAQSVAFNCNANGTVVNVNLTLNPGTYYLYINSANGQGTYETGIATTYTVAGVGTFDNKVYNVTVNGSNIMTVNSTINNAYGPLYDFKFVESIPDACPRFQVQAVVNATPAQPDAFTQSSTDVCKGQNGVLYAVPAEAGVAYAWSYSGTGFTLNSSGASLSVNASGTATSGVLSVVPSNGCGSGTARTINIAISSPAATPGVITGNNTVCAGASNVSYSVIPVAGTTYNWTYRGTQATLNPTGASLSVNYLASATSGNISVTATNSCGTSAAASFPVVVNTIPAQPAAFTASVVQPCKGTGGYIYTVPLVAGLTYNWTYTGAGATITGTGNSVTLAYSSAATNGDLQVTASNTCGASSIRSVVVTLNDVPAQPAAFTASVIQPCKGTGGHIYTVPLVAGLTYNWTYTGAGATITGTGNSVTLAFSAAATNGDLQVTAANTCGTSSIRPVAITMNDIPAQPAAFTATVAQPCKGTGGYVYSVPLVAGLTYNWTYSAIGATITGSGNAVTLAYSPTATSGNLQVTASNTCGVSSGLSTPVTINSIPAQPANFIAAPASVCLNSNTLTYSIPPSTGVSYVWSYTGTGMNITGSGATILANFTSNATSGTLSVKSSNQCGQSLPRNLSISVNPQPQAPSVINGTTQACTETTHTYTIVTNPNFTYQWNYNGSGVNISSGSAQVDLQYTSSASSGDITVSASNICGTITSSPLTVTVNAIPVSAGTISGVSSICTGSNYTYSVPSVAGVSYNWSYSGNGVSLTSSGASVALVSSGAFTPGSLLLVPSNQCGTGVSSVLALQAVPLPHQPVTFTHSQVTVTQGNTGIWYEVQAYPGETYHWSYSGTGATFAGLSLNAQQFVDFSTSATSGNISVRSVNSCGVQSFDLSMAVNVIPLVSAVQKGSGTLSVYPNPIVEWVTVDMPVTINAGVLSVTNVDGVVLRSMRVDGQQLLDLSLAELPAGVYVISIASENEVYRTRLIKQ